LCPDVENGQFTLGNTAYTTASLVQTLQGLADALTALDAAHGSVKDGVAALRATFSNATPQLGDFDLQAPKARQPLTTEKRVVATAKLKATRAARGTTSKKKKLAVKGDVTGVIVTPVTRPALASPPATPAGPAPTATASAAASK
jgi:hypothetical protein